MEVAPKPSLTSPLPKMSEVKSVPEKCDVDSELCSSDSDESSSSSDSFPLFQPSESTSAPKKDGVVRNVRNPPKTRGELDLDELPPIEELNVSLTERDMENMGSVYAIVDKLVVVRSLEDVPPLDLDSVLFLNHQKPLGRVFDVFGPVSQPFYSVRFNDVEDIAKKGICVDALVYYAPSATDDVTRYILLQQLTKQKGSDASWKDNNEPPEEHLDYSDDEQEQYARKQRKTKNKNKGQAEEVKIDKVVNFVGQPLHLTALSAPQLRPQNVQRPAPAVWTPPSTMYQPRTSSLRLPYTWGRPSPALGQTRAVLQTPALSRLPPVMGQSSTAFYRRPPVLCQTYPAMSQTPPAMCQAPPAACHTPPAMCQTPPTLYRSPPSMRQGPPSLFRPPPVLCQPQHAQNRPSSMLHMLPQPCFLVPPPGQWFRPAYGAVPPSVTDSSRTRHT